MKNNDYDTPRIRQKILRMFEALDAEEFSDAEKCTILSCMFVSHFCELGFSKWDLNHVTNTLYNSIIEATNQ